MFKIKLAGMTVRIDNKYEYVRYQCRDYIEEKAEADFEVSASNEEILAQQAETGCALPYGESLCIYRNICKKMLAYDALLVHSVAVSMDGEGYLFLAKSGTGKSTHAGFWLEEFKGRAEIINGDKPIIRRLGGKWQVFGTPWQGKEDFGCNKTVPLKALCFLQRGEENKISPAETNQIMSMIFHQLLAPQSEAECDLFFALLEDLLQKIPCWLLCCRPERAAAKTAFEGMNKDKLCK